MYTGKVSATNSVYPLKAWSESRSVAACLERHSGGARMELLVQILLNGILLGGLYGLMALGMALVWGVYDIVNLSHGALIMMGGYRPFFLFTLRGSTRSRAADRRSSCCSSSAICVQRGILNLIVRAPLFNTLLITFGLEVVLTYLAHSSSADLRAINPAYAGANFTIGGITIPYVRSPVPVPIVLPSACGCVLLHTRTRAAHPRDGAEPDRCAALRRPAASIYAVTFGLGAALAGVAGGLYGTVRRSRPILAGRLPPSRS